MPGFVRPVATERDALLAYLEQQRYVLRLTAYGLTDEQARMTPSASELSIGGVIKHVTAAERRWADIVLQRYRLRSAHEYAADFRVDGSLADVLADYQKAAEETDAVIADIADLDQDVPVPGGVPWFPADVGAWSVRWVLLHLIGETARHAGHADIIRESLDGATAFSLMAAAENWPPSEFIQPWQPPTRPSS